MSKFDNAFAKARKSGLKEFSFDGKKFNTKLAGTSPVKKKASPSLPSSVKVGPSKPAIQSKIRQSAEYDIDSMAHSPKVPSVTAGSGTTSIPSPNKDQPFLKHTEVNGPMRSALNDFRESESRRASDESIGMANASRVKKAIGKFMLGKGYND